MHNLICNNFHAGHIERLVAPNNLSWGSVCLTACIDPPVCEVNDQPVVSADVISLKASEATRIKTSSVLFIILTNFFFKNNSQRLLSWLHNRQSVRYSFDVL